MFSTEQPIRLRSLEDSQNLSMNEIHRAIPILSRLTNRYRKKVDIYVSRYGKITEQEVEREVLSQKVASVLLDWAEQVRRLGGEPRELWTVHFFHAEGIYHWEPE